VDVVDGSDEICTPREQGEKLFGRGSLDMLFAVACYVELLKELDVSIRDHDIGLMLTSDEEQGGFSGARLVLEEGGYSGELVFLPDGGGTWKFEEYAKGMYGVRVTSTGVTGHGSRPWIGRNAIQGLSRYLTDLEARFARFEDACSNEQHWHATLNIDRIRGGAAEGHQIAADASAVLDIRYTSPKELGAIETMFELLHTQHPHTSTEILYKEPCVELAQTNGHAKRFSKIAKEKYNIDCGWARAHGSSDARFFQRHGMQTLLILPKGGGRHSEGEWIDVPDMKRYYEVLKDFVRQTARLNNS
jgi:succinyl-diaminopimelate desuccinylase